MNPWEMDWDTEPETTSVMPWEQDWDVQTQEALAPGEIPGTGDVPMRTEPISEKEKEVRRRNEAGMGITPDPSLPELVAGGIYQGGKNFLETAAALATPPASGAAKGVAALTDRSLNDRDLAKVVSETLPDYTTSGDSLLEDTVFEGATWLPGMIGGARLVSTALPAATTTLGKVGNFLVSILAGDLTAAGTTAERDVQKVFISDDEKSLLEEYTGLPIKFFTSDDGDTFSEEVIKDRLNLIGDTLIASGLIGTVATPLTAAGGFLKNFVAKNLARFASQDQQKLKITEDLLNIFSDINPEDSAKIRQEKMKRARDYIEKNKDVLFEFSQVDPNLQDVEWQQDLFTTLIERLDPQIYGKEIAELENLKNSSVSGRSPKLEAALDAPSKGLQDALSDVQTVRGTENISRVPSSGTARAEQIPTQMGDEGFENLPAMRDELGRAQEGLKQAEADVIQEMAENPLFNEIIEDLSADVNLDLSRRPLDQAESIVGLIDEASKKLTTARKEAYDAIGDSEVDLEGLQEFIGLHAKDLPESIKAKLGFEEVFDETGNLVEETIRPDVTFRTLVDMTPEISTELSRLVRSTGTVNANVPEIRALRDLQKHVFDDQLQWIKEFGNPEIIPQVEMAEQANTTYKKYFRDSPLEDIQFKLRSVQDPELRLVEPTRTLVDTVSDPMNRRYTERIFELLQRPEAG